MSTFASLVEAASSLATKEITVEIGVRPEPSGAADVLLRQIRRYGLRPRGKPAVQSYQGYTLWFFHVSGTIRDVVRFLEKERDYGTGMAAVEAMFTLLDGKSSNGLAQYSYREVAKALGIKRDRMNRRIE